MVRRVEESRRPFSGVGKQNALLNGLDLLGSLGIYTVQRNQPEFKKLQKVVENSSSELIKAHFVKKSSQKFFTRLGKSKSHQVYTNFKDPLIPRQIEGRREPIHIQDRVSEELMALVWRWSY